jgi:hypothetical protein
LYFVHAYTVTENAVSFVRTPNCAAAPLTSIIDYKQAALDLLKDYCKTEKATRMSSQT